MRTTKIETIDQNGEKTNLECIWVHSLVIGSGAAGLNAALQCYRNSIKDVLIITEGLTKGTSINTGSDKQTYYKMSMCGSESDSPRLMAESYLSGGSMHGDLALIEASLSLRAFYNLVNLGVDFPRDQYGQFVGYKTDHDPRQRATSIGPYTSREMCIKLTEEIHRSGIPIHEDREVVELITTEKDGEKRIVGALALNEENQLVAYAAENVIFAVGGPGGLYQTSVYPAAQFGGIGLALMAGARARNLPESQFGLASTRFRWNVSGTYMQVIPRFVSFAADGASDEQEFLRPYFESPEIMNGTIFLKGYQWPFDARKVIGGSSLIDLLVYIETMIKGRRVFLDFRKDSDDFSLEELPVEARVYLTKSGAQQNSPIERLLCMNPSAVKLYEEHGIQLAEQPLEIAVCAQHNNGGLAGTIWWESTNIKHLFPVGEVNGSHGVNRPGGSALNSGQVGGFRAAEYIANRYADWTVVENEVEQAIRDSYQNASSWIIKCEHAATRWNSALKDIRKRMSLVGAQIRSKADLEKNLIEAEELTSEIFTNGCQFSGERELKHAFRIRQLSYSHLIYLKAINQNLENNVGSRGSSIVLDPTGEQVHPQLGDQWRILPENESFRKKILETWSKNIDEVFNEWVETIPIPETDAWFETTWAEYSNRTIYNP
jgi:succinate dehydrogenase/fumarate reductase flavoprotein subunit